MLHALNNCGRGFLLLFSVWVKGFIIPIVTCSLSSLGFFSYGPLVFWHVVCLQEDNCMTEVARDWWLAVVAVVHCVIAVYAAGLQRQLWVMAMFWRFAVNGTHTNTVLLALLLTVRCAGARSRCGREYEA